MICFIGRGVKRKSNLDGSAYFEGYTFLSKGGSLSETKSFVVEFIESKLYNANKKVDDCKTFDWLEIASCIHTPFTTLRKDC